MEDPTKHTVVPDLVLLPLDDEFVAFSEMAQSIIGLNAGAAAIVRSLQAGETSSDIVRRLTSDAAAEQNQARAWLDSVLHVLGAGGMLAGANAARHAVPEPRDEDEGPTNLPRDMPALKPFEPVSERRYRLLDTCALIRFHERAQLRMLNSVIGHLAVDESTPHTLTIDIVGERWGESQLRNYVYCDGQPAGFAHRLSFLSPMVKGLLWRSAINAHPFLFYIHAGVVGVRDGCVLFPAAPGSGKSSLTAALVGSGYRYLSDEVALVETSDFDVLPMPMAFCAKRSGWEVMAQYFPHIMDTPMHRRFDEKDVRYVAPPPHLVERTPQRARHIVFPKYEAQAETRLVPVSRADALRNLMDECLALRRRLTLDDARTLTQTLARVQCHALTFSSLSEAVGLVTSVVGQPGSAA